MAERRHALTDADRRGRRIRIAIGDELRIGRTGAGLSQRTAAAAAGISHTHWGRIERGEVPNLGIDQACRAASVVGLRLSLKTYPDGDPLRDAGQLALLERFRARLPAAARWQTEVPMPIPGDARAWDAVVSLGPRHAGCEAEVRLLDLQALERRLALKVRDGGVDLLLLVVADTIRNRSVLRMHREQLRALLPLDSRDVLASLRAGQLPRESGIVVL